MTIKVKPPVFTLAGMPSMPRDPLKRAGKTPIFSVKYTIMAN